MSIATAWATSAYQRILSARVMDGALEVQFEDGARARVEVGRLLPPAVGQPDWSRMTRNAYELIVPTTDGDAVISWVSIRAASDPAYAEHLARSADERARTVGQRLAALRESRGLTVDAVAERAHVDPQMVATIEAGHRVVSLGILRRLVAALGGSLRDLADPA